MKCRHCGREIVRIRTMSGFAACDFPEVTYWPMRQGEERTLLTPNGQTIYKSLTGEKNDAEGIGYLPHTCHLLHLIYKGRDSWSRPVYEAPDGTLYVDVDPRADRKPDICTKQGNAFDGEPCDPVGADFDFIPRRDTW